MIKDDFLSGIFYSVPNLRFPLYKNKWECKKIKDILKICHGKDYKHLESGKYPVLGTSGIFTYVNQYLCDWPCALIGRKGASLDKPHYMNSPFWCVDTLYYSKPVKNNNPKWQYYFFQTINWMKMNESSGIPSLRASTIENIDVFVPSYQEQSNIVEFLDKIEQRIETQIKIIDDYSSVKDYIIKQCFQKCKEYINLGNLFKYGKAGGTPKSTIKEFYDGNIPFMGISDITNQGKYISYTSKNITQKGLINSSAWLVPKNSLILSMYASVGLPAINKIPLATSQAMMSMIFDNDLDVEFVYYYLCYFKKSKIQSLLETGTQSNINADTVKSIKVPKLRADEKEKITNIFIKVDQLINNEKEILNSLQKQKNFLLKNMFV